MDENDFIEKIKKYLDKDAVKFLIDKNIMNTFLREFILEDNLKRINIPEVNKKEALNSFLINKNLKSNDEFEKYKKRYGMNKDNIESIILKPLKIKILAETLFNDQAESRFLRRKNDLNLIVYSIIRNKNKALALELFLRIDSNEDDFSYLASKHSEGTEKITNGIVGPLYKNQVNPILMDKLKTLKEKEVLEPFKLEEWWVILRLENKIISDFTSTIKQKMCLELFEEFLTKQVEKSFLSVNKYILGK